MLRSACGRERSNAALTTAAWPAAARATLSASVAWTESRPAAVTSCPRRIASSATCDPTAPVAPRTRIFMVRRVGLEPTRGIAPMAFEAIASDQIPPPPPTRNDRGRGHEARHPDRRRGLPRPERRHSRRRATLDGPGLRGRRRPRGLARPRRGPVRAARAARDLRAPAARRHDPRNDTYEPVQDRGRRRGGARLVPGRG